MAHRRGNIHGIIPAALGIAGLACGIAVFICLEQSTLGIAVEYIFLVEIGGTTENKFPPVVVARLGEGQLVILRAALGGDGDVEIGRAAAGKLIRRGGSHPVFKVRQDLAVAALELGGGPCGQVGERHGEAAVVILLEMGIVCQLAGEGGGFLVKGQGHFGTGGAVLMDGGEGYIAAGEEVARRLEGDGVGLRGGIAVIAHLQGDDGAHLNGDGVLAAILRAAHIDADAILLVAGGGGDGEGGDALGQNHGIVMHTGGKGGVQLTGAEGDGLQGFVAIPKSTADICTQVAGVLHGDLVPGLQLAVGHGVGGEALTGEPVVEGAHPAGALGGGLLLDAVDFADVAGVRTGLGIAPGRQCVHDAAHHGGVLLECDPLVHQHPLPGCAVGLGPGGVFHRHMDLTCVVVRRQHARGKQ